MDNHVHLLLHEEGDNLARLIKRINVSFVYYFNKKYKRIGHLFQDRFKSEIIDNENYLLAAVRYIHNNPVKAGMVNLPEEYCWSSYYDYINTKKRNSIVTEKILNIFSENTTLAVKQFIDFSSLDCDINFMDFIDKSNDELRLEQEKYEKEEFDNILILKGLCIEDLLKKDNSNIRNEIVIKIKQKFGLSASQMAEITNISRGTVLKIYNEMDNENRPL